MMSSREPCKEHLRMCFKKIRFTSRGSKLYDGEMVVLVNAFSHLGTPNIPHPLTHRRIHLMHPGELDTFVNNGEF